MSKNIATLKSRSRVNQGLRVEGRLVTVVIVRYLDMTVIFSPKGQKSKVTGLENGWHRLQSSRSCVYSL